MTRSDGAPQFGLLPAGTAFERKWIAYEERAAAVQFWVQNGRDCRVEYELPFDVKNEKRECITVCVSSVSS